MRFAIAIGRQELKPFDGSSASTITQSTDMIQKQVEMLKSTREKILELISDLSAAQLNEIPGGFVNNIAWHVGHLVATQQSLCYQRAGAAMLITDTFFDCFKPGTKPEDFIDETGMEAIKRLFRSLPDRLEADKHNGVFENQVPWTNRYGVVINNIGETLSFVLFHEGLHLGYIMALRRALRA